jgi:hypothetical protein
MNYVRFSRSYLVTIAILVIGLIGFAGCAVNAQNNIVTPEFEELKVPPIEVTIDQLYADYVADGFAAEDRYSDKRLLFYGVTVEEVLSIFNLENDVFVGNEHIVIDNTKFFPRHSEYFDNIREGFIVDIVGQSQGLTWPIKGEPFLKISDCWINVVEGDIIEGWYKDYDDY